MKPSQVRLSIWHGPRGRDGGHPVVDSLQIDAIFREVSHGSAIGPGLKRRPFEGTTLRLEGERHYIASLKQCRQNLLEL